MTQKEIIKEYKKYGLNLVEKDGKLHHGGNLDLRGTGITSLPDNFTVGGYLYLEGTGITSLPDNLTVGGYLDLEGTGITSLPDNFTVGGYLDLRGTGITSLPDNLTVGGNLDLEGTGITSLPDNLTVGGYLYLEGTGITDTSNVNKNASTIIQQRVPTFYTWKNRKYIKADEIFSIVVSHKGNVYKIRQIGNTKERYLITDGNGKWAHGDTLQEAKNDLIYKISNRDKSSYKDLTSGSVLTFEKAIEAYRVITGACSSGTRGFVESRLKEKKEEYSILEIAKMTKGEYGNKSFVEFFGLNI
ncbi:MAG: hypothetical protein LBV72_00430 [Tannerella sp.]|jgi:hypothetical protein|nr:hypothetical protein [Tannerella sp.]